MNTKKLKTSNDENSGDKEALTPHVIQLNEHHQVVVSPYFKKPLWFELLEIEKNLFDDLLTITYPNEIAAVYNPLDYASQIHCAYMKKFLDSRKLVIFIGMNPGPWGMCQTGVPFGYVPAVRDWMKLEGVVTKPGAEISNRAVTGLDCTKTEQSGLRFWGLIQKLSVTPEVFFKNCYVHNLCPLAFFHSTGRNITPPEIKGPAKGQLQEICNKYLAAAINLLSPNILISVGKYTNDRINDLRKKSLISRSIENKCLPHPSPRSLGNTNWNEKAEKWFVDNNVIHLLEPPASTPATAENK